MIVRESSNNLKDEIRVVDKSETKHFNSMERMAARITELERSEVNLSKIVSELQEDTDMFRSFVTLI
ncbi:hypothetical protein KKB18_00150, partial [bacterium]|nr:hypothetical protein [bacterium]